MSTMRRLLAKLRPGNDREVSDAIDVALPIFAGHLTSDDDEIEQALLNAGISVPLAHRIIEFVPLAFGRVYLRTMRVATNDYYVRYLRQDDKVVEKERKRLDQERMYALALKLAQSKGIGGNFSPEFMAVAGRSAEVNGVMIAIDQGSKPENLVLTSAYLQWRGKN